MAYPQFSTQEVIRLLSELKKHRVEYPPELLATRRRLYLSLSAQLAATRIEVEHRKPQILFSIEREPVAMIVKVLIAIFVAFLVAFVAHSIATGYVVDFGWLRELLTR
jgi:hypothetical protein